MVFAPDTEVALRSVVNLINTAANGEEHLATAKDLDDFLEAEGFTGSRTRDEAELASVRYLRGEIAELCLSDEETAAATVAPGGQGAAPAGQACSVGLALARHHPGGSAGRPDEYGGGHGDR